MAADPLLAPLAVTTRWLFLAAITGMAGVVVFRLAVGGIDRGLSATYSRRLGVGIRRMGLSFGLLGLALAPLRLDGQARAFFDDDAWVPENVLLIVTGTPLGRAWIAGLAATVVFLGVVWAAGRRDRASTWVAAGLASVVLAAVPAVSGHAWAEELRALAVVTDTVHVLAAGAWLGGLGTLAVVGIGGLAAPPPAQPPAVGGDGGDDGPGDPPLAAGVDAFSRTALVAVAALVVTGLVSAWLRLGSLGALFSSAWGRGLLVKTAVVAVAFSLGAYNWRVVRPALRRDGRADELARTVAFEWLAGLMVLLATAVLVVLHPPE